MWELLGIIVAIVVALFSVISAIVAFLIKYALLPYIEKNVVKPLFETHHQVTQNSHTSETPTLPDRLDDLKKQVGTRLDDVEGEVAAIIGIVVRMQKALDYIKQKVS